MENIESANSYQESFAAKRENTMCKPYEDTSEIYVKNLNTFSFCQLLVIN